MSAGTGIEIIRARVLEGVTHGFLGRHGGVSTGIYASLNVGLRSGDSLDDIARNRRLATEAVLPGARLVTVDQVHSPDAIAVVEPHAERLNPRADALVTATPGLALGIYAADCAPVLLADREAGVIGAAHAGWEGALAGVTDLTVSLMEALGARRDRIAAAIGPCIARASYEVGDEFLQRFADADPANARFFADGAPGKHQFDLEAYVAHRLAQAGLTRIELLGLDTYADPGRFFSCRRAAKGGHPGKFGRQISIIGIN